MEIILKNLFLEMAYNRQNDRERLFQYSEGGESFARKETALDMDGAHYDRLRSSNARM